MVELLGWVWSYPTGKLALVLMAIPAFKGLMTLVSSMLVGWKYRGIRPPLPRWRRGT